MHSTRGFEELPHTADVALRVWAEDIPALFTQAALGMNSLAAIRISANARIGRRFEHEAQDEESLLVAFLTELIFEQEQDQLGFDSLKISLESTALRVEMGGASLLSIGRHIKAVTFHNLRIQRLPNRYQAELVFDV